MLSVDQSQAVRHDLLAMHIGDNALAVGGVNAFVVRHTADRWSVMSGWSMDAVTIEEAIIQIGELNEQ